MQEAKGGEIVKATNPVTFFELAIFLNRGQRFYGGDGAPAFAGCDG